MATALQAALADAAACLESEAGAQWFFGSQAFTAWPVRTPETLVGSLEGSPDNAFYFEAQRSAAPSFKRGDKLTTDAGDAATVSLVRPANPTTGIFLFAITRLR